MDYEKQVYRGGEWMRMSEYIPGTEDKLPAPTTILNVKYRHLARVREAEVELWSCGSELVPGNVVTELQIMGCLWRSPSQTGKFEAANLPARLFEATLPIRRVVARIRHRRVWGVRGYDMYGHAMVGFEHGGWTIWVPKRPPVPETSFGFYRD